MLQQHSDLAVFITQNTKLYSFSLYQVLHSFLLNYSRLQHTEFRESSSSLLTPGGMKSLVSISQGSLQVHRVGKRQHLIVVSAWHSLHAVQPPRCAPCGTGMEIVCSQKCLAHQSDAAKLVRLKCYLSSLVQVYLQNPHYLFNIEVFSFQAQLVVNTFLGQYQCQIANSLSPVSMQGKTKQNANKQKRGKGCRHLTEEIILFGLAEHYQKLL